MVYYDIRFGTTPDPEFYFRTTDTALALPQLNALQTYYWQIVAVDSRRATTAGPVWSFTTANLPPLSPSSPVPADGATIVKDNVSLNWAVATDPDEEDIVSYNVYFGSSPTLSLAADNITETAYTPGDLIVGNTYFWQIVAIDSHGGTTPGPVWSFTTIGSATVLNNVVHAADTTLTKAGGPYIVRGGMTVNAGITLTIEAGTVLKFEDSASLTVNGTLLAQGSPAEKIIFTSFRDDRHGGDTNGDGAASAAKPGDWSDIIFSPASGISILEHCEVSYGGRGSQNIMINQCSPLISHSSINHSLYYGIRVLSGNPLISDNSFTENSYKDLVITGNTTGNIVNNYFNNDIEIDEEGITSFSDNTFSCQPGMTLLLPLNTVSLLSDNVIHNSKDCTVSILYPGGTLTKDANWPPGLTYDISGNLAIAGNDGPDGITTLQLGPGTTLRMHLASAYHGNITVGGVAGEPGALVALGSNERPVVFTSKNITPAAGDWVGISFQPGSAAASLFDNVIIEYAQGIETHASSPTIRNSFIRQITYGIIIGAGGSPVFENNTVTGSSSWGMTVSGGPVTLTHNLFTGNANHDVWYMQDFPGGILTGNTFADGLHLSGSGLAQFSDNTIGCSRALPVWLSPGDLPLLADNLLACAPDGSIKVEGGGIISKDTTWDFPVPMQFGNRGNVVIQGTDGPDGVTTLTIAPGSVIKSDGKFTVGGAAGEPGALQAMGTEDQPIKFTSALSAPARGDWSGIRILPTATNVSLDHCEISYAGNSGTWGDGLGSVYIEGSAASISHSKISNSQGYGIYALGGSATVSGSVFENNGADDLRLYNTSNDVITGNSITNGMHHPYAGLDELSGNTIGFSTTFPITLDANEVRFLNGNTLQANGTGYIKVTGGLISKDATWPGPHSYKANALLVQGTDGPDGVTSLTLDPGVELKFQSYSYSGLTVGGDTGDPGALIAVGTPAQRIRFTSDSASPVKGDWASILIKPTAAASTIMEYCEIEYGGRNPNPQKTNLAILQSSPTIRNSVITKSLGSGVYINGGAPAITFTAITGNATQGMTNAAASPVTAENNWWGDSSGPHDPSDDTGSGGLYNPDGSGQAVSDGIDYSPWLSDTSDVDEDNLPDSWEMIHFSFLGIADSGSDFDGDGMPDWWEYTHDLNPILADGAGDADHDGLTNYEEFVAGADPTLFDPVQTELPRSASFLHAPHNEPNGITCRTCHEYPFSSWPEYQPDPANQDDTIANYLCLRCHAGNGPGLQQAMHSSQATASHHPEWTTQCIDCHDPHFQAQLQWTDTDPDRLYLVTGTVISAASQAGITKITYSLSRSNGNWSDPASWSEKTGVNRGLLFIPDTGKPGRTFEVLAATSDTILVRDVVGTFLPGKTFGLIYGQMLRYELSRASLPRASVKFFDPATDFVDSGATPTPTGICQVCHTQTAYYRADGSGAPHEGGPCTPCHAAAAGFAHP